jgi:hypothetical protein
MPRQLVNAMLNPSAAKPPVYQPPIYQEFHPKRPTILMSAMVIDNTQDGR